MQNIFETILEFLFGAPKGDVRKKHLRSTALGIFLGLLAAVGFGFALYYLNKVHRIGR
jgi:high-affinity Fe2+/Pb2+ permease